MYVAQEKSDNKHHVFHSIIRFNEYLFMYTMKAEFWPY